MSMSNSSHDQNFPITTTPVLIAAGGTGGHVYPALAVARVLQQRNVPVIWMGTQSGLEARVVPEAGIDIEWINVVGLRGKSVLHLMVAPFKIIYSLAQTWRAFGRCNPGVVLGMGGFVAGPSSLVALLRRKPLVIHEQNSIAGLTNRWVSRFASRIFTAFPDVFTTAKQVEQIGNPVRADIEAIKQPNLRTSHTEAMRILVVGGSLGAHSLNVTVPDALALCGVPVSVWQQTGPADLNATEERYRELGIQARVSAYIEDMVAAYTWADLIICRAGAMTVSELAAVGLASVLIPYPFAVDDHQTSNAMWLVNAGAGVILSNQELTPQALAYVVKPLLTDQERRIQMAVNARSLHKPHAAEKVADALLQESRS